MAVLGELISTMRLLRSRTVVGVWEARVGQDESLRLSRSRELLRLAGSRAGAISLSEILHRYWEAACVLATGSVVR